MESQLGCWNRNCSPILKKKKNNVDIYLTITVVKKEICIIKIMGNKAKNVYNHYVILKDAMCVSFYQNYLHFTFEQYLSSEFYFYIYEKRSDIILHVW